MKPVDQVYDVDCMSACVASILELPITEVPLFGIHDANGRFVGQHEVLQKWLHERGLTFIDMPVKSNSVARCRVPWESTRATWCIITLKYKGYRDTHAVVGSARRKKIRIAHDPYQKPDRVALKGRPVSVGFIVPCDLADWVKK